MEYKAEPEYDRCVEISTNASIKEMMLPGAIALITPILIGFGFQGVFPETSSAEMLGGLLAGVTVSGVLMGMFQNNAGGAWDNAKKSFEAGVEIDGKMEYKGSDAHKASVTGDTVGDPFKDTSGPSMNILIKLMSIVSLVIAPHIHVGEGGGDHAHAELTGVSVAQIEALAGNSYEAKGEVGTVDFQGPEFMSGLVSAQGFQYYLASGQQMTDVRIMLNAGEIGEILQSEFQQVVLAAEELRADAQGRFNGMAYIVLDGNAIPVKSRVQIINDQEIKVNVAMME
jgi:hypothetical protein